jgi:hypothetical protein
MATPKKKTPVKKTVAKKMTGKIPAPISTFVKGDGSREDLLADLQEIYLNHGKLTRSLHETHGRYTEHTVKKYFGGYGAAKHVLGITDVIKVKLNRIRSQEVITESIFKQFGEEMDVYKDKYQIPDPGDELTLVVVSDMHDFMCDPFVRRSLIERVSDIKPEIICLNGDIFDVYEFSTHNKEEGWSNLGKSLQWGSELFADFRKASPNSQIDLIQGNHELRIQKRIAENPELREMAKAAKLSISSFLRLDDYGVNYIGINNISGPDRTKYRTAPMEVANKFYFETVLADHYPSGINDEVPGFNGHHHVYESTSKYNRTYGQYNWVQLGGAHIKKATYTEAAKKWSNGFMTVEINKRTKKSYFIYHDVQDHCWIGNKKLVRTEDEMVNYEILVNRKKEIKDDDFFR